MRRATGITASALGLFAGFGGPEHGYFQVQQGHVRPDGLFIASIALWLTGGGLAPPVFGIAAVLQLLCIWNAWTLVESLDKKRGAIPKKP
jgi:hypothetical protein